MPKLKREDGEVRATDFVESLHRGLRLLQAFGERPAPMSLSEIAQAVELPRATARRILFTLQHGGFVSSDGKQFALTPHVLTLAGSYLRSNPLVSVLQPVLDRISVEAQAISSLAVLDGGDVVFIARAAPTRIFAGGLEIGYRLPAFCTAVGRAMLGRFNDAELKTKLSAMRPEALTPQTVTEPKRLLTAIAADRTRGYSLVDREAEPHFRSIAVPVQRYDSTIVGAINIGAHVDRISTEEMVKRFLPLLREGAEEVRARLL
ncbi:MAG: helix-turn-helix domain-containing protein [Bradyrhizobium sp.]|nr:helix-turn-helix domain-containing protein [Bradyrhizobium sp.]